MTKINKFKTFVTVLLLCIVALGSAGCFGLGDEDDNDDKGDITPAYEISADGKYMYFGSYPQTLKAEDVTITYAVRDTNGYYTGSDGEKYAKLTANMYDTGDQYKASDGTTMTTGTDYYFKVEPLKWRILSNDGTTALIVCDSVIEAMTYQPNCSGVYVTDGNGNYLRDDDYNLIYANNYKYSQLRAWLNSTFYDTAFTSGEQALIQTTEVDNSVRTTGNSSNKYACENTNDKVFALSYKDVLNTGYGFSSNTDKHSSRYWYGTDYAKATYLAVDYSTASMLLRSPYSGSYDDVYVIDDGYGLALIIPVSSTTRGAVPALQISL